MTCPYRSGSAATDQEEGEQSDEPRPPWWRRPTGLRVVMACNLGVGLPVTDPMPPNRPRMTVPMGLFIGICSTEYQPDPLPSPGDAGSSPLPVATVW